VTRIATNNNRYRPAVRCSLSELRATTVVQFGDLLRLLVERSGVSAYEIARRTAEQPTGKIGSSQVYHMLRPNRKRVPRKIDQIRSFGLACGLDRRQNQRLVDVWLALHRGERCSWSPPSGRRGRFSPDIRVPPIQAVAGQPSQGLDRRI
jgi:hypothetical protein